MAILQGVYVNKIIGREKEICLLRQIQHSKKAEFVALYGRRRVGKTFLIQQCLSNKGVYLECAGLKDGNMHDQLTNFIKSFQAVFHPNLPLAIPRSWRDAFELLTQELKQLPKSKRSLSFWTRFHGLLQRGLDYCKT